MKRLLSTIAIVQAIFALRVFWRMARTTHGTVVKQTAPPGSTANTVTVLVPVLNEIDRLAPCFEGLTVQGPEVMEILVVDGGSTDGTRMLIHDWVKRDSRVRYVDASPVPIGRNGKAHGLHVGHMNRSRETNWILTIDADVRPNPKLTGSLLAHALEEDIPALSVATLQQLSGFAEGLVHPAMLTTLVYRFGIPGHATDSVDQVQANGQCFLVRTDVLDEVGGFASVFDSVCEDVTLARSIAAQGYKVGFYETDRLVTVQMYSGWRDAWKNWSRSLPMRDRFTRRKSAIGLLEASLVQALPGTILIPCLKVLGRYHPATLLNVGLMCARFGVLAGISRGYALLPWTYWLSPLCDVPVIIQIWRMWGRRQHSWRGRALVSGEQA